MAGEQDTWLETLSRTDREPGQATAYARAIVQAATSFWPLLIAPLLLLALLDRFPYPSVVAPYSDITISHYSNALFLLGALREWGQIPLWSPTILGGYPFAANPLSGLFYPPGWLAFLLPLPLGFNLVAALHLLWGGLGMYRFLRVQGLGHCAGLCGALAFQAMPKLFAHFGAGHLTFMYAVPWTPWLLWAWQRSLNGEKPPNRFWGGDLLPGVVLGTIFLADVRWAGYAGALWWSWSIAHSHYFQLRSILSGLLKQSLFAGLLAAPLAFPLLEYTRLSTRDALPAQEVLTLSLPAGRLLGLFIPGIQGFHEWMFYPGATVLALAACALVIARKETVRSTRIWAGIAVLGVLASLGSQLPFAETLAALPGFSLLRVPARALFLTGVALAVLSANGLERILKGLDVREARRATLVLTVLAAFPLSMALSVGWFAGLVPPAFAWGVSAMLASGLWIWIGFHLPGRASQWAWLAGLSLIAFVDLGGANLQVLSSRSKEAVLGEGASAAAYLAVQPGRFRVYSPSYSIPQQTAARYRLELLNGVDPLQLENLAGFMEQATGVPRDGYSVTIPSFATGTPALDNRAYRPDPERLSLLNVAFVAAEYDLPVEGLELRARFGETRVYENMFSRSRAWVEEDIGGELPGSKPAGELNWTPNEIAVRAAGPGVLVLSEIAYPGWQVHVDGERQPLQVVEGLLRGVRLEAGEHAVVFQYRPASLLAGICLSLVAVLFLVIRRIPWRAASKGGIAEGTG